MPFDINVFNAKLLADNPTYNRVLTSDLDAVVKLLRSGGFNLNHLAAEMKKVSSAKWEKYKGTKAYLIEQFPLLPPLLKATVIDFKTTTLKKHMIGIEHGFMCVSDTGDLKDLAGTFIREHVSWKAPSAAIAAFMVNDPHYKAPNHHYGNAGGKADWPIPHQDVHGARQPFNEALCKAYAGVPISLTFDQVYEFSSDNKVTWKAIPNSAFTLVRTLSSVGGRGCITMKKTNVTRPQETVTSDQLFFP